MIRSKKQKFLKKLQDFCGQTATKKKHPHPPKKFNRSTPQSSFVLMGTSWISALRRRHRAFHSFQQFSEPFFRRISFGAKVGFVLFSAECEHVDGQKKMGAGITRLRAPGVHLQWYC